MKMVIALILQKFPKMSMYTEAEIILRLWKSSDFLKGEKGDAVALAWRDEDIHSLSPAS